MWLLAAELFGEGIEGGAAMGAGVAPLLETRILEANSITYRRRASTALRRTEEARLEATIAKLDDRARIVLVTSTARFAWVKPSNQVMAAVASRHDNVVLADWRTYSTDKDGWFKDGLHLTEKGKPYFGNFVKKAALSD